MATRRWVGPIFGAGFLSTAISAGAADISVSNDAQLRNAITNAASGDTITFNSSITLASNLPQVMKNLTINGGNFTLSGENKFRGLFVQSGNVAINNLTIANTIAKGGHGGPGRGLVRTNLGGSGGGGAGLGGALFIASGAGVIVSNVTLRDNAAEGGNGGLPTETRQHADSGHGGTMFEDGDRRLDQGKDPFLGGQGDGDRLGGFGVGGGGAERTPPAPGGFGGGGGGQASGAGGSGGFGGGTGGGEGPQTRLIQYNFGQGGGGAGMGGAIFVQQGGALRLAGNLSMSNNRVRGGRGFENGEAYGPDVFFQGNGSFILAPGAGATVTIGGGLIDERGTAGQGGIWAIIAAEWGGRWAIIKDGAGTAVLTGETSLSGGADVNAGVLQINAGRLSGSILNNASVVFAQTIDGTYSGNMSGSGSLIKSGPGSLRLIGTNSYRGGTVVAAGNLIGDTASLQGFINNNAIVTFDQPFDGTYDGSMVGAGRLIKNGPGKLSLPRRLEVGDTLVIAGALAVQNQLISNVTVAKGAALSGVGRISGNIINLGGKVEPGNSIGELTVNGNVTWDSGTFVVEVGPSGASDRITVEGAGNRVTVNAGTLQVVPEPGIYVPNTRYTILTAPAGGIATFNDITGGIGFLTPALSFDDTNLYLSLVLAPNAFRAAGQTVNQQAVGGALDAIASTGNVGGLITTMANLNPAQGASAFQALSPEPYADFGTVNTRSSELFMNAVGRQMAGERGAAVGAPRGVALAEACDVACDDTMPPRFSAWLSGIGSLGSVLGNGNASGLSYTLGGTAFGIDYRLDPRFLVGIAGGYVGGSQWVNGFGGNGYTGSLSVALYGSFTQRGFYADALAGYANSNNRLQRVVAIPGQSAAIANGQTSANQFLGQLETGYRIGLPFPANTSISPFGRLQVGSVDQAAFSESGTSLFNLSVAQQTTTSVRTIFGADFGASFDMAVRRPLDIGLRLGWMHEFADTARPISAAFAAAPIQQFTVFGATPQRDSAVIGFSATAAITDNASLFTSYDGEVGGGTDNHALRVGFRMTW